LFGGADTAIRVVTARDRQIHSAQTELRDNTNLVPPQLVQAVMFVENNYNGGPGGKTALPMNLNFNVWRHAFDDYNRAHPNAPITQAGVRNNPQMNILAGTIILSTINAAIDPAITGNQRWALVASMYGNTEDTLQAGRPIMYGGKVAKVMEERYQLPSRRAEINALGSAEVNEANLMGLRPLGTDTPARTAQRTAGV
jgi:hypothetical protein